MSDYVPGTDEQDPKKVIMALQLAAENISTAQDAIDTNASDIVAVQGDVATNTADIASHTADIAALQTGVTNATFPSGTVMIFVQTAAPTGWTKVTAHNDKTLRVVSGTASGGGSTPFSTIIAQSVVGSTTLSLSQIPSHSHNVAAGSVNSGNTVATPGVPTLYTAGAVVTDAQGGGGSHNHSINLNMQYVDCILATKN
jgi:hypothetical protein